jgi:hypothetical protein
VGRAKVDGRDNKLARPTMPNITRNNHYVPEATLKRWSMDGQRVWAYRLLVSHRGVRYWRPELISRLTRQTDFYTDHRGGRDLDSFETFITRQFEEPGQRAIEKLLVRGRMAQEDWCAIARFVVTQDLRTPQDFIEWTGGLQSRIQESLESAVEKLKERIERQRPDEQNNTERDADLDDGDTEDPNSTMRKNAFEDVIRVTIDQSQAEGDLVPVRADVRSVRSAWLARVQHLLTGRAEIVCQHHWCKMVPAPGEEWPLTDHPVLRLNFNSPAEYNLRGGWGHAGSEFIMPVSPRLAVYTQVGRRHAGPLFLDPVKTRQLQQLFVERAYRWVLAREPIPWVEQFRTRIVDSARFYAELAAWKNWHNEQTKDETEFENYRPNGRVG